MRNRFGFGTGPGRTRYYRQARWAEPVTAQPSRLYFRVSAPQTRIKHITFIHARLPMRAANLSRLFCSATRE